MKLGSGGREKSGRWKLIVVVYQEPVVLATVMVVVVVAPRSGSVWNHPGCTRAQSVARCPTTGRWYIALRYLTSEDTHLIP